MYSFSSSNQQKFQEEQPLGHSGSHDTVQLSHQNASRFLFPLNVSGGQGESADSVDSDDALDKDSRASKIRYTREQADSGGPFKKSTLHRQPSDDDHSVQLRRKRVSDMSPEERLKWSRMQSRDHSRRSRQRRKLLEEELRLEIEQLQSFRTLIEDSYQLVSIQSIDTTIQFLYANSVFFRALNYVPQDLIGISLLDTAHPNDRSSLQSTFARIIDEGTHPAAFPLSPS